MALAVPRLHSSARQPNPTALSLGSSSPAGQNPSHPGQTSPIPNPSPPSPSLSLSLSHRSRSNSPLGLDWVGFRAAAAAAPIPMNPNGHLSTCPKHPTQPPFTGFCSACLLERLSAAHLPSASSSAAASEITTETDTRFTNPRPTRTTLLYLFQLDDMADGSTSAADHLRVHIHSDQQQDPPSLPQAGGAPPLQRKRSLRQPCDWIVCCDDGSDSRQSWDGSAAAAAPSAAAQLVLDRRTRTNASLGWNQVWDRRVAKPLRGFVSKPAHILLLTRSLSEGARAGVRINGSHSTGMDSEIPLPDSSIPKPHVRRDSLTKRLYWLGRSCSVHYSSPPALDTAMLRFHLTPLSSSKTQGRRLNIFAAQRHHQ